MPSRPEYATLYPAHLAQLVSSADAALAAEGFDHLLIGAGTEKFSFLDDRPYPFRPNPHFKHWLPLTAHPGCWISHTPGQRPVLVYVQPDDFWHLAPEPPEGYWAEHFDIRIVRNAREAGQHLPTGRTAVVAEADAAVPGVTPNNPERVVARLHWDRARKSAYEIALMQEANHRAVPGHVAARAAFAEGHSELDIHRAYLAATGHSDTSLPYLSIVGLNEHGAVLHYQHHRAQAPAQNRSLLIDAGAEAGGYCADITRTWCNGDDTFQALVDAVDVEQRALADAVRPGRDYVQLHLDCHLRLGGVLERLGIVRMAAADQVEAGITRKFFPHGLGHFIGLQVHDVGGHQAAPEGGLRDRPAEHPFLRLSRPLEAGHAVTIEPGIYFIESFLADLAAGPHKRAVDWQLVDHLKPFGGVRIEDDVACTADAPENLTRDAFTRAEAA